MEYAEFHTNKGYQDLQMKSSSLTPAMEDYLEMIGRLCARDGYTRTGTLSEALQVKPSSASKMISKLKELGYIQFDRNRSVDLTPMGQSEFIYLLNRHNTIEQFLTLLGNPSPLQETELIEHSLSIETVSSLGKLVDFFNENPDIQLKFHNILVNIF